MTARLLRPAAAWLVLMAAVSGLAGGCGGSGGASAGGATLSAVPPITKARAKAYARTVNLHAADLPGMRITKPEGEDTGGQPASGRGLEHCVGVGPDRSILNRHSAAFARTAEGHSAEIHSQVAVWPTAAFTSRNNAALRSRRGFRCVSHFFGQAADQANSGRVEFGSATVSRLPTPLPSVTGSFGYRVATTVSGWARRVRRRVRFHVYVDIIDFTSGPAEIGLVVTTGPLPPPAWVEHKLLSLLYSRAKARHL